MLNLPKTTTATIIAQIEPIYQSAIYVFIFRVKKVCKHDLNLNRVTIFTSKKMFKSNIGKSLRNHVKQREAIIMHFAFI